MQTSMKTNLTRAAILCAAAVSLSACYSRVEERTTPVAVPSAPAPVYVAPSAAAPPSGTVIVRP